MYESNHFILTKNKEIVRYVDNRFRNLSVKDKPNVFYEDKHCYSYLWQYDEKHKIYNMMYQIEKLNRRLTLQLAR